MQAVLVVLVVVISVLLALMASALTELFRQVRDLRRVLQIDDRTVPLDIDVGLTASDIGLPMSLSTRSQAIAVFLSTTCATCLSIAHSFEGGAPESVWFVLEGVATDQHFLMAPLQKASDRVIVDDGSIAERLGVNVTPSVLTFEFGRLVSGQGVSTVRQVLALIPVLTPTFRSVDESPFQTPAHANVTQ